MKACTSLYFGGLYFIAAFINWGYLCQRPHLWSSAPDEAAKLIVPIMISSVWPFYWMQRGVLEVTKP